MKGDWVNSKNIGIQQLITPTWSPNVKLWDPTT
jgi:hypothetical protein